ncbi:MAG: hypothetical protein JRI71_13235 [Deltaproteobacteria bacterium]|nr:hypothetical protein [Deltaproteobacteria bacterium]MBW2078481.1 hypothetical protein [Deltaproteobacteria bacterium]
MGKDIFWECSAVTNRSGMNWLKRYFGVKGIRIHPVLFDNYLHPWHIDVNLIPLRPGLAVFNPDWPPITEEALKLFNMNDWELIPAARPTHWYDTPITVLDSEQGGHVMDLHEHLLNRSEDGLCGSTRDGLLRAAGQARL